MDINEKINDYLNENDSWEKYKEMLAKHDWWYSMADGPAYEKGKKQRDEIKEFQKNLSGEDKDYARYLFLKKAAEVVGLTKPAQVDLKKLSKKFD